jgi:hypothetical protein
MPSTRSLCRSPLHEKAPAAHDCVSHARRCSCAAAGEPGATPHSRDDRTGTIACPALGWEGTDTPMLFYGCLHLGDVRIAPRDRVLVGRRTSRFVRIILTVFNDLAQVRVLSTAPRLRFLRNLQQLTDRQGDLDALSLQRALQMGFRLPRPKTLKNGGDLAASHPCGRA